MKILSASLWVGAGGFAGSVFRYLLTLFFQRYVSSIPWGTMVANVLGCFLIGLITEMALNTLKISPEARLFYATGFCGGLTTWSSLVYESVSLSRDSEWFYLSVYLGITMIFSLVAFFFGVLLIKSLFRI